MTMWAYEGHPTKAQGIPPLVPIRLAGKIVVNAQLDYNLLLGRSYMYAMQVVASTVFCLMMFPHEGKIVMVDQLTYHDLQGLTVPSNVIPTITTTEPQGATAHANVIPATNTVVENTPASPPLNVGPGLFTDPTMMAPFPLMSPPPTQKQTADLLMVSSSTAAPKQQPQPQPQPQPQHRLQPQHQQ